MGKRNSDPNGAALSRSNTSAEIIARQAFQFFRAAKTGDMFMEGFEFEKLREEMDLYARVKPAATTGVGKRQRIALGSTREEKARYAKLGTKQPVSSR